MNNMADSDFYEDDEPIEKIRAIISRGPDGYTAPTRGGSVAVVVPGLSSYPVTPGTTTAA